MTMIEARLRNDPETIEEWVAIRNALAACKFEAEVRVAEAHAAANAKKVT